MIWIVVFLIVSIQYARSTPPACFLSCIGESTRFLCDGLNDLTCACKNEDKVTECLIDICPYGAFLSARDHFIGTCLEHGRPSITNPFPPPSIWPPSNENEQEDSDDNQDYTNRKTSRIPTRTKNLSRGGLPYGAIPRPSTRNTLTRTRRRLQPTSTRYQPPPSPSPPPSDSDSDSDSEDEDYHDNAYCEWEDTDSLDEYGNFIIIRRPINVPKQFRDPQNVGNSRSVFIKHGTSYSLEQKNRRVRVNIVNSQQLKSKPRKTLREPNKIKKYTIDTPEGKYRVSRSRPGMYS
ncbi:hypothetical protein JA1_001233 [Spathaspora sp. JA1]|nr:hypothetical protein JA1_001233 [Spathaspora sp. JA1]